MNCSCERLLSNSLGPDKAKRRALIRRRFHRCRAAPGLDDFSDHRKPDAGAFNLVAWRQSLENAPDPLVELRIDAGAVVAHRELERIPEIPPTDANDYVRALDPRVFQRVAD